MVITVVSYFSNLTTTIDSLVFAYTSLIAVKMKLSPHLFNCVASYVNHLFVSCAYLLETWHFSYKLI